MGTETLAFRVVLTAASALVLANPGSNVNGNVFPEAVRDYSALEARQSDDDRQRQLTPWPGEPQPRALALGPRHPLALEIAGGPVHGTGNLAVEIRPEVAALAAVAGLRRRRQQRRHRRRLRRVAAARERHRCSHGGETGLYTNSLQCFLPDAVLQQDIITEVIRRWTKFQATSWPQQASSLQCHAPTRPGSH